jgi:D-amino-acid dehydrogenase
MKILVLGAGITGVTAAYLLSRRGHEVTVVERHENAGRETSFANGGQLSYSHAEPWANPEALVKILKWIWRDDAPLKFRPSLDPHMWAWSLKFLAQCSHKKALITTANTLRLALYSRVVLQQIAKDAGIDFHYHQKGILHIFRSEKALEGARKMAKYQESLGCPYEEHSLTQCLEKIPTLKSIRSELTGGLFFPTDESGDIFLYCQALAKKCAGVEFKYGTHITRLLSEGDTITGVETDKGTLKADRYVMAMGSYSAIYLRQVGVRAPIYPMKGYSISVPLKNPESISNVSLTDQEHKLVYSRLGNVLRVAGTAEFAGYSQTVNKKRVAALKTQVARLYPGVGDVESSTEWACIRPQTPDGAPILGRTKYKNLILNTGHGTLGWTLGPGSSQIITDLIDGKSPGIDLSGLTIDRY